MVWAECTIVADDALKSIARWCQPAYSDDALPRHGDENSTVLEKSEDERRHFTLSQHHAVILTVLVVVQFLISVRAWNGSFGFASYKSKEILQAEMTSSAECVYY